MNDDDDKGNGDDNHNYYIYSFYRVVLHLQGLVTTIKNELQDYLLLIVNKRHFSLLLICTAEPLTFLLLKQMIFFHSNKLSLGLGGLCS